MEGNPIREIRLSKGETLHSFAKKLNVNYQTLYQNEIGCYPQILRRILDQLIELGYDRDDLEDRYRQYIVSRRHAFKEKHEPFMLPPVGELKISPIVTWREYLGYSRSAFCKALCLQPSQIQRLERNRTFHFCEQLEQAFRDIDFPRNLRVELVYRTQEYFARAS